MNAILAVFRSRSQTLEFISRLNANGICATAVTTPREANVGCGISARLNGSDLYRARYVLNGCSRSAFVGFFCVETKYGRTIVRPV